MRLMVAQCRVLQMQVRYAGTRVRTNTSTSTIASADMEAGTRRRRNETHLFAKKETQRNSKPRTVGDLKRLRDFVCDRQETPGKSLNEYAIPAL